MACAWLNFVFFHRRAYYIFTAQGIGKKLLMKMGFKGRLGKNEDGVTRQLEVKVRPGLSGLGFGNFKEATTLKVTSQ